ncbi:MAG TPA: flagellar export protein FliJ [Bacilli bacterium]
MRFKFALQKIVDLKKSEKTQAEWVLAQSLGKLRAAEHSLNELLMAKQTAQAALMQSAQAKATVSEIREKQHFIEHLDKKIAEKSADVYRDRAAVEQNKSALAVKMVDEKVWLGAKDRAYARYLAKFFKAEQDQLDEMAAVRHQPGKNL